MKTSVGQPTTLYIEARGNPPPEITWTKNGSPVNDPLLQNGSLYIHSTTPSDQGTYTVTATSNEGSTSETIKLVVLNPQYVPCELHVLFVFVCICLCHVFLFVSVCVHVDQCISIVCFVVVPLQPISTSQSKWRTLLNTSPCYTHQ